LEATGAGALFGLAGCTGSGGGDEASPTGTGTAGEGSRDGGKLLYTQQVDPQQFDPLRVGAIYSYQITKRVFDPLYEYGAGTDLEPKLATGQPEISRDGTRYVVEITDEATFHDGSPLTAEDVKYTYTLPKRSDEISDDTIQDFVDSVEVVDEQAIQIDLQTAYVPFEIGVFPHSIVSKEAREADPEAYNKEQPIGSGPYEFAEWEQGEYVKLERFDDYWDEQPHVEEVEFVPVTEPTTRATRLKTGESDVIDGVPPQIWDTVKNMEDVNLAGEPGINYYFAAFNMNEGPTADPKVREGIDYAFSMDRAVQNFVEPAGQRNPAPVPVPVAETWDFPLEEWSDIQHDQDLDKTKELFDSAGVPDDYTFTFLSPPDDTREKLLVSIANGIEEAGWDTEVQRLDWGTFLDKSDTGNDDDYNMYALGYLGGPDPDLYLWPLFHESTAGNAPNGTFYENDSVMANLEEARVSTDRETRRENYISAITQILEDRAHLAAYSPKTTVASKDYVNDMPVHSRPRLNPRMVSSYNNTWLDSSQR
jgi:peptide/nickel transport system substrate-binding protein